jgi:hypothetical protein
MMSDEDLLELDEPGLNDGEAESDEERLVIVPEFQHQCRICGWSKENIELYNWVSNLSLRGFPPGTIAKKLAEYLKETDSDIKPPTKKSVWTHFEKHISPKESVDILVAKRQFNPSGHDPLINVKEIKEVAAGNFDEYIELCKLYTKFRQVHDKIYELTDSLLSHNKSSGVSDWSQSKIQTFVSMVNTQKGILAEIGKMRQGDKLVNIAAQYVIEVYMQNIVDKLSEEFKSLASIMKRHGVSDEVMLAYENITHEKLAKLLVDMAGDAMTQTRKEFKLPN